MIESRDVTFTMTSSAFRGRLRLVRSIGITALALAAWGAAFASETRSSRDGESGDLESLRAAMSARDYALARSLGEQLLVRAERQAGPDAPSVADVLDLLVEALWRTGRSGEARTGELAERAVAIRARAAGPADASLLRGLNNLAVVRYNTSDFPAAREAYALAAEIQKRVAGPDQPAYAKALLNLGEAERKMKQFARSRECLERALAIYEATGGPDSVDAAKVLNNLGSTLAESGRLAEAVPVLEQAVARWEHLAPGKLELSRSLNNLANAVSDRGDYARAIPLYERAIEIKMQEGGPDAAGVVSSLYNLATLLRLAGDLTEARHACERALASAARAFEAGDPMEAIGLDIRAEILRAQGDSSGAEAAYRKSLQILEASPKAEPADLADTLAGLADLLSQGQDPGSARPLYERSLRIREDVFGPRHPFVASCLVGLGRVQRRSGDPSGARELLERALAIRIEVLGEDHPDVAEVLEEIAAVEVDLNEPEAALENALQAERIGTRHLRLTSQALSQRQALHYARVRASGAGLALGIASRAGDPKTAARVWDMVIRGRASVLEEMVARRRAGALSGDPEIVRLGRDLSAARSRLSNITMRGPDPDSTGPYFETRLEAALETEAAERALAERSAVFRQQSERSTAGLDDVRASLPDGSPLVAFVAYERAGSFDCRPGQAGPESDARPKVEGKAQGTRARLSKAIPPEVDRCYAAFVLGDAESEVRFVPLGSGREIDAMVARFATEAATPPTGSRAASRRSEERLRGAGEELRRVVWDPLHISPGSARLLLVVPDGALSRINFGTLPAGNGRYLVEKLPLVHYATAERDLASLDSSRARGHGLLAMGGARFDGEAKDGPGGDGSALERPALSSAASERLGDPGGGSGAAQGRLRGARTTPGPCARRGSLRFEPLPASAHEVRDVVAGWKNAPVAAPAFHEDVYSLIGPDASERAFKELAPGRLVLHVATHGFELSEDCEGDEERNPMLFSGLALSGANLSGRASGHGGEDGLLTSEEICSLDLSGVDWVVLSGCDTGAGAIQEGEGVLGLRRAFAIAGARTVIMSLWEVEDDAARRWMRRLYAERAAGRSTAEAVREASLEGLTQRRRRGRTTHPFYWGAFVAAGDWR